MMSAVPAFRTIATSVVVAWLLVVTSPTPADAAGPSMLAAKNMEHPRRAGNKQRFYGPLGNAIAWAVDQFSGRSKGDVAVAAIHESSTTGGPTQEQGGSTAMPHLGSPRARPGNEQRSYGVLGSGIAWLVDKISGKDKVFGNGEERQLSEPSAKQRAQTSSSLLQDSTTVVKGDKIFQEGLEQLRDLIFLIGSNFRPDPTLDNSVQAFLKYDAKTGIDPMPGNGGLIAGAARMQLLVSAKREESGSEGLVSGATTKNMFFSANRQ